MLRLPKRTGRMSRASCAAIVVTIAAAAATTSAPSVSHASDLIFGDFESGLDPFLDVVQFNGGPNTFNGSVPSNATHGSMAGSFTVAPGFQQYLRYNNGAHSPGTVFGDLGSHTYLAFDINVPAGTVPTSFFVHELVINASVFNFTQSGNLIPVSGPPDDLKGRGTVTLAWNYRNIPDFDTKYAQALATPDAYFQVLLVSNYGNGWDGGAFTIDNLRLTDSIAVPIAATWTGAAGNNWSASGSWTGGVPDAVGASATFADITSGQFNIAIDGSGKTVGALTISSSTSYTLGTSGGNSITMDTISGAATINVSAGGHVIAAPLSLNKDTTFTITPAGSSLTVSDLQVTANAITKAGAGNLAVNRVRSSALTVNAGTVAIVAGGSSVSASKVTTLTIAGGPATPTAAIDMNDNDMVIGSGTSKSQVTTYIRAARNGGGWNSNGITSSAARNRANHNTTLGVLSGAEYSSVGGTGTFSGQGYSATDTLIKYTYYGDTDFNGIVNFDDYSRTDAGFNNNRSGWLNGDFDLNNVVDFDDYSLIDLAFNTQSGTLRRAMSYLDGGDRSDAGMNTPSLKIIADHFQRFGNMYASSFLNAVPEPSSLALTGAFAFLACRRRRFR